jgi:hypothetical protein
MKLLVLLASEVKLSLLHEFMDYLTMLYQLESCVALRAIVSWKDYRVLSVLNYYYVNSLEWPKKNETSNISRSPTEPVGNLLHRQQPPFL